MSDTSPNRDVPAVRVDDFETGQVGCSALVAGVFLSGMLLENGYPLGLIPLWGVLALTYRYTAATARVGACPGCGAELRFDADVALCRDCLDYARLEGDRLLAIEGDHRTTGPGFECSLDMLGPLGAPVVLPWGDRCCACDEAATSTIEVRPASVASEAMGGLVQGVVTASLAFPCCAAHQGAVRNSGGALRMTHYRTWRELVDANARRRLGA